MKKYIKIVCIVLFGSLLVGCGSIYQTHYTYQMPVSPMGKMCVAQCFQVKQQCQQQCQLQDQRCRTKARQDAYYHYAHYREYQASHGLPVQKQLNDFDQSYSQCFHTCQCVNDFNVCYQHCGGVVLGEKECVDCDWW